MQTLLLFFILLAVLGGWALVKIPLIVVGALIIAALGTVIAYYVLFCTEAGFRFYWKYLSGRPRRRA